MQLATIPLRAGRAASILPRQTRAPYLRKPLRRPSRTSFSTQCRRLAIAAPEIDFEKPPPRLEGNVLDTARVVPASPSYFSAKPQFTDSLVFLQALLRKYQTLPITRPGTAPRVAWRTLAQYRELVGEEVKSSRYSKILKLLNRLHHIHPEVLPEEVAEALKRYKRDIDPFSNKPNPVYIDQHGRAIGVGRRKSSSASVWLVEGEGEVLINGNPLHKSFGRVHDRESAIWALKITKRIDKYNVWGTVRGGGTTGQAEALTLAIAKALLVHEPSLKPALRRAGCITRDPRRVERKKPGKLKARKMPAWVKR